MARPTVALTLGKFDGVHAGHRALVARVLEEAGRREAVGAALVLHPDPRTVVAGLRVPILTTVDERLRRLRALGVGVAEPLRFTRDVSALSPEAFVDRLAQRFRLRAMVVGPDFGFGRDRSGDVDTLRALGGSRAFDVVVVPPVEMLGDRVSSHRIRALVEDGDIATARALLGTPPGLSGVVVHGLKRGRELGFPTANLDLTDDFVVPANGIYTIRAAWTDAGARPQAADGLASIGIRPTFDPGPRIVEVYLLDFTGDLYGRVLSVEFLARQRGEEKFDSVEALVAQMNEDVVVAREHLASKTGQT